MSRSRPSAPGPQRVNHAVVFAALGDKTRLALVAKLAGGKPRSISQLTHGSNVTRQAITKHLRVLERVGLVESSHSGRENQYALQPEVIASAKSYLETVSAQWDDALSRLRAFVEK